MKNTQNMRYLYVTDCEDCDRCVGELTYDCPRKAQWRRFSNENNPKYTGYSEATLRALALENPEGTADAACRAADSKKLDNRVSDNSKFEYLKYDERGGMKWYRYL